MSDSFKACGDEVGCMSAGGSPTPDGVVNGAGFVVGRSIGEGGGASRADLYLVPRT